MTAKFYDPQYKDTPMREIDLREKLQHAALLLECAMPHFERLARTEAQRNQHATGLREVTNQNRLRAARALVDGFAPRREGL